MTDPSTFELPPVDPTAQLAPGRPETLPPFDVPPTSDQPAGRRRLDRRAFLGLAGGVGALGALGALFGPRAWDALFGGDTTAGGGALGQGEGSKLVLLTLYGGNDGLNTVIPYQNPAYASARGPLAVEASSVLPLADGFGLHAGMPGFKKLWDAKELAIVHGVGFANPNYSHFESMDIWQSGDTDASVSTGWLGRWLDGTKSSPLRAIALGPTLPTALSGERVQGAAIPIGPLVLPGDPGEQALYAALARAGTSGAPLAVEAATSDAVLLQLNQRLGPILSRSTTANPLHVSDLAGEAQTAASELAISDGGGGRAGGDVLAVQLSVVANLILAGASADVYSVELGRLRHPCRPGAGAERAPVPAGRRRHCVRRRTSWHPPRCAHDGADLHRVRSPGRGQRQRRHRPRLGQRGLRRRPLGEGRLLRRAAQPDQPVRGQHGLHDRLPLPLRHHVRRGARDRPQAVPRRVVPSSSRSSESQLLHVAHHGARTAVWWWYDSLVLG